MSQNIIQMVEVGPRDGLQNEKRIWTVEERVQLINLLSACGFIEIEVGSFVSPKWVPQMADTDQVFRLIHQVPGIRYSALVPNEKGLEQALANQVRDVSIFTAASEAFNQKNINCSIEESFVRFQPVLSQAKHHGLRVRGYVSCAIECPYSGVISPEQVAFVAERLWQAGCAEISLGDTIGKGNPETIAKMVQAVKQRVSVEALAIHCHDTYGQALENILSALDEGIRVVDSAVTGLGGCPYGGEKAKGNVATELVAKSLPMHGYVTPINLAALENVCHFVQERRSI
jgi:hydroxymethylglutaryl-CoA lyase